jgi:16S rRNA A1518/A1519 N6-dimethyltransferase RsmA/KsgA/DIM1 with predicted DNA glycosylase/AP lyase activity
VHAVELDEALCEELNDRFASEIAAGRLTVQQGDATRCDLPAFEMGGFTYFLPSELARENLIFFRRENAISSVPFRVRQVPPQPHTG